MKRQGILTLFLISCSVNGLSKHGTKFPKTKELVRKSWVVSGYRSMSDLDREGNDDGAIVMYDRLQVEHIVENAAGADALTMFKDPENDPEEFSDGEGGDDEDGEGGIGDGGEIPWVDEYDALMHED